VYRSCSITLRAALSVLWTRGIGAERLKDRNNPVCPRPQIAVGDLNRDGKPDLAVADFDDGLAVLLGNGTSGFGAATSFAAVKRPASMGTALEVRVSSSATS